MNDATIIDFSGRDTVSDPLTDLLRKGAQELLQAAVEAERDAFLSQFTDQRTAEGHAAVVRNGHQPERAVQTGIGPVNVKVPKVRSNTGKPVSFRSALVPPCVRKAKSIEAALPWLYLKGISTGEMGAAPKVLPGPDATGFPAKTISRLKGQWAAEYDTWRITDLGKDEWVYVRADGLYSGSRGADDRLCVLVVIGLNARGEKHFLAIEDGVRESAQSWREVLLSLKNRGFSAHALLIVDGAGWHDAKEPRGPDNITLLKLPPYAPELNPMENVWQYLRANKLAITVFDTHDEILDKCSDAWNFFANDPERINAITHRD